MSTSTAKPTTGKLPSRHSSQRRMRPTPPLFGRQANEKEKEQQQTRRRETYLGKVRQKRDDRTWEGRSEMVCRAFILPIDRVLVNLIVC